jgi:hypothetical protein
VGTISSSGKLLPGCPDYSSIVSEGRKEGQVGMTSSHNVSCEGLDTAGQRQNGRPHACGDRN